MESTFEGPEQARASGRRLKNDLSEGVSDIKAAASSEIKNLIADVEDLMARIADLKDADVVRVRSKVQRAVDATKQSLADGADAIRQQRTERGKYGGRLCARQPMAGDRHRRAGRRSRGDSSDPPILRSPTVRLLWSLPKAAPALLRHLVGLRRPRRVWIWAGRNGRWRRELVHSPSSPFALCLRCSWAASRWWPIPGTRPTG